LGVVQTVDEHGVKAILALRASDQMRRIAAWLVVTKQVTDHHAVWDVALSFEHPCDPVNPSQPTTHPNLTVPGV